MQILPIGDSSAESLHSEKPVGTDGAVDVGGQISQQSSTATTAKISPPVSSTQVIGEVTLPPTSGVTTTGSVSSSSLPTSSLASPSTSQTSLPTSRPATTASPPQGHGKRLGYTQLWVSADGRFSIGIAVNENAVMPIAKFPSANQIDLDCENKDWYSGELSRYSSYRGFGSHDGVDFRQVSDLEVFPAYPDRCSIGSRGISAFYSHGSWLDPVVPWGPTLKTPVWFKFEWSNLVTGEVFLSPSVRIDPNLLP